jgi:fructose/tagatose bisphosphate aldolase
VKLRPKVLKECQDAVVKTYGEAARFYLVFYGGSGSTQEEIHEALDYGVVKMNVDTDMQYGIHTRGRRADVQERRRRAESGRRSRQQESL